MRRIGIDVGGTNTDAVLIEDGAVRHAVKVPTTEDVTSGIVAALAALAAGVPLGTGRIDGVMIGTTHFVNAVVQRRSLTRVGALRLGLPASASLPPLATGRATSPRWSTGACGWSRAGTTMTAVPSCRWTRLFLNKLWASIFLYRPSCVGNEAWKSTRR